ncbi:MAG: ATP-dependent RecD-like DNA helicase [Deltaproteobacteria bacterium]|nr:ATP-dependent RecD-like DNA helicase [Deltaproteobacteria bacterium]
MSPQTLKGVISKIVYQDQDRGFAVFDVENEHGKKVRVAGSAPDLAEGLGIRATGQYQVHPRFGRQFKAATVMALPPETTDGIAAYLASGRVDGVGKTLAGRIVDFFGDGVRAALDEGPDRLRECPGIGGSRAQAIHRAWNRQMRERETFVLLASMGLTAKQVQKVAREYGEDGPARVKNDPYDLIRRVTGIGFKTADSIAANVGIEGDAPTRMEAAVRYVLETAAESGHVFLVAHDLIRAVSEVTSQDESAANAAVRTMAGDGRLVVEKAAEDGLVFEAGLHRAETRVARRARVLAAQSVRPARVEAAGSGPVRLAPSQKRAVSIVSRSGLGILTGGPGTGKTTIVGALLRVAGASGLKTVLAAPTGRAAMRLKEATGREAKTLHRLLEFNPRDGRFQRNETNPLDADWILVDESSMLDIHMMDNLLKAVTPGTRLTFVGDADQLPPVGPGDPFRDLIRSDIVPVARLTEVFRQGEGSQIVAAAYRVLSGREPGTPSVADGALGDFYFLEREDPAAVADAIEKMVVERIPARFGLDPVRQVQVLAPMRRGDCGTEALNRRLRDRLNPRIDPAKPGFAPGDRLIQNRNNYEKEVFNGDIGVAETGAEKGSLLVRFEDRRVEFKAMEQDDLSLAHAITVHKAQGSEFPAVVVSLHTQHYVMLQRNLLYTALTRGRRLVVLCGNRRAVRLAVNNARMEPRNTRLAWRLRE